MAEFIDRKQAQCNTCVQWLAIGGFNLERGRSELCCKVFFYSTQYKWTLNSTVEEATELTSCLYIHSWPKPLSILEKKPKKYFYILKAKR